MQPLLEMPAGGVRLLNLVLILAAVAELVVAIVMALTVPYGVIVGITVAASALPMLGVIAFVIPVRYEVWARQLSIVFLFGRHWDIPFNTIESAATAKAWQRYAVRGVRFATAPAQSILITRRNPRLLGRPNIVISPRDRSVFLPALQQAMGNNPEA